MSNYVQILVEFPLTMSSREIAELTGKEHKNILAEVRKMLSGLGIRPAEFSARYRNGKGERREYFNLPKRETLILVSGYSVPMRAKLIDRWEELEAAPRLAVLGRKVGIEKLPTSLLTLARKCPQGFDRFTGNPGSSAFCRRSPRAVR